MITKPLAASCRWWRNPIALLSAVCCPVLAYAASDAPGRLLQPAAVVIHVHDEITDQRFVPLLVARLARTLAPAIRTSAAKIDLAPFRLWIGAIDAHALLDAFAGRFDWQRDPAAIQIVIIDDDIRLKPSRFSFAASAGDAGTPFHLSIVSLARLQRLAGDGRRDSNPDRTAERAFKLIAKNVARLSGYGGSTLCLFAFPRSLAELDATPESFCEPDLAALVAAGIARPMPR